MVDFSLIFVPILIDNADARAMLDEWGLEIEDKGQVIQGRVLEDVTVEFGGGKTKPRGGADWGREARSGPVFRGVDFHEWLLMFSRRGTSVLFTLLQTANDLTPKKQKIEEQNQEINFMVIDR